jgi:hypothetical protein
MFAYIAGKYVPVAPNDIATAFQDILKASGRTHVLIVQSRNGGPNDHTVNGAFIDASFTPTGLYTPDPNYTGVYLPVTVQQFANYFGFDHFNFQQQVTLPKGWSAIEYYPNSQVVNLGNTFADNQQYNVEITGKTGLTGFIKGDGDGSGLFYNEHPPYWPYFEVNPFPLVTGAIPAFTPIYILPASQYWFTLDDAPRSTVFSSKSEFISFVSTLVGVRSDGTDVSLNSPYGTQIGWTSHSAFAPPDNSNGKGITFNYLGTTSFQQLPPVTGEGIANIQYDTPAMPPAVITDPVKQIVAAGTNASFTAAALASADLSVQWQVSTDGGHAFSNVAGATSTTLTLAVNAAENANQYRAVFTNSAGSAATTAAMLSIATSPVVITEPTSQVASAGNLAYFVSSAVGNAAPTVQWQVSTDGGDNFSNLAGATSGTLTFMTNATQNGNQYRAVFDNALGSATSKPATLTVNTTASGLVIDANTGIFPQFNLVAPAGSQDFGASVVPLSNGNVAVTAQGAAYLYNGLTGVLISAFTGLGDLVTVTPLANGNYVIDSPDWHGGLGAVTWANGISGITGTPSAVNSLIGSRAFDHVGNLPGATEGPANGVTALSNGNYVVDSPNWGGDGAALDGLGAVTWGNGATGTSGVVSAANSLVGSSAFDMVGGWDGGGVTALPNGNYVVDSPAWGSDAADGDGPGAVTWGNGATGISGVISVANSLVGSVLGTSQDAGDGVGSGGVTPLTNGNYVVDSDHWNGGEGAVSWGNGTTGFKGFVSAANSLVGSNAVPADSDSVGAGGITALTNGNYVVDSPNWALDSSTLASGAVTWGSGTSGVDGAVSVANSLVGSDVGDEVGGDLSGGGGITALSNGNYVVDSLNWGTSLSEQAGAGAVPLGAVTWESGTASATGTVSAANSLIGYVPGTQVGAAGPAGSGGVTALANGNYVVDSPEWESGIPSGQPLEGVGAVTWADGTKGITGLISSSNSLVGSSPGDQIGLGDGTIGGVVALDDGNYVVDSPDWSSKTGAVTWANGASGLAGTVLAANSLVGDVPGDAVGGGQAGPPHYFAYPGIFALPNGNYVVLSPVWNKYAGAATWGNGASGVTGFVSSDNSLIGFMNGDSADVAVGVVPLPSGNYVVSVNFGQGIASDIWVNGATGVTLDGQNTSEAQNTLMGVFGALPLLGGSAFVATNANQVTIGLTDPNLSNFALGQGQTITVAPSFITSALDAGRDVTIQANNDLTVDSLIAENPSSTAGNLTLEAGRNILLNASIDTAGGNLKVTANDTPADGVFESEREPGSASVTKASGVSLLTGSGTLDVNVTNAFQLAAIRGTVFQDINTNGVQDSGEPGIAGVTLFLDLDGSGVLKPGDPATIADASGNYQLVITSLGTYTVKQLLDGGVLLNSPASGSYQIAMTSQVNVMQKNFADVPTSIALPLTLPLASPFPKQGGPVPDYVEAVERAVLKRNADPGGLAYWSSLLGSGQLSVLGFVQDVWKSPEHFSQEVTDFYVAILGRTPDVLGLQYWVQQLENGMPEEKVVEGFLDSQEYLSKGDKYFVDQMYIALLGRTFDADGEAYWLNLLGDDQSSNRTHPPALTYKQVIHDFLYSPESLTRLVQGYYQIFLQRLADPLGLNDWLATLQQGASFSTLAEGFLASDEFFTNAAAQG